MVSIVISQSVTMASEPFHLVVIGDSIAFGAGLEKKNIPPESVKVQVLAHTGATLSKETSDPICSPDLSSGNPTAFPHADMISNPNDVDLILVSAGINDIGVDGAEPLLAVLEHPGYAVGGTGDAAGDARD